MRDGTRLKTFERADGKERCFIVQRRGLYCLESEEEREEDGFTFWVPSGRSGYYGTSEDVERLLPADVVWVLIENSGE